MVNKVIIIGNLGQDPELRYTQGGQAVCRLSIATSRKYLNKQSNEMVEETEWHRVTVWGKQAENCNTYLTKGRSVYVEGRLRTSSYEKDGQTHYSTEIVAEEVKFLGGGSGGDRQDRAPRQGGGNAGGGRSGGGGSRGGRQDNAASRRGQGDHGGFGAGVYDDPYVPSDPGDDDIPF